MPAINYFQLTQHFNLREFQCHHCGTVKLDPAVVIKLQAMRTELGCPLYVLSGYRCPTYNTQIGGAKGSYHMLGQAADVTDYKHSPDELAALGKKHGFTGIGRYYQSNFVHLDTGPAREWTG